jgi:hypothetical protein
VSVFIKEGKGWDDVDIVGVVFVRVAVRDNGVVLRSWGRWPMRGGVLRLRD